MKYLSGFLPVDRDFSIGLTYYEIMDLPADQLSAFLAHTSREELVDWLQWNDPNGIYSDEASLAEFGTILSKEEGIEIVIGQVLERASST